MTMYTRNSAIVAALQGIVDLADVGANPNAKIITYAGIVPADNDAALGGATLITSHDMDVTSAFGIVTDANPGASSLANPIASAISQNVGTETLSFFRIVDRDDVSLYQGNIGANGTESTYLALPSAAGTGYAVDDVLTVSGGTFTQVATFEVVSVDGSGGVISVRVQCGGTYTVAPGNPASTSTGGGGSGCTLNLTFTNQFELQLPTTTIDPGVEIEIDSVLATLPEQSI